MSTQYAKPVIETPQRFPVLMTAEGLCPMLAGGLTEFSIHKSSGFTHWQPIEVLLLPPKPKSRDELDAEGFVEYIKSKTAGISLEDQNKRSLAWHAALAWHREKLREIVGQLGCSVESFCAGLNASGYDRQVINSLRQLAAEIAERPQT